MNLMQYNDRVLIGYQHKPVVGSGNAMIGPRYRTTIYLMQGSQQYDLGEEEGKLSEEEIRMILNGIFTQEQERQYGQRGTLLRRELKPRREMIDQRTTGMTIRTRYKSGLV